MLKKAGIGALILFAMFPTYQYGAPKYLGMRPLTFTWRHYVGQLRADISDEKRPSFDSHGIAHEDEIPWEWLPCDHCSYANPLGELVEFSIDPGSWAPESGTYCEWYDYHLKTIATLSTQLKVAAFLREMRRRQWVRARVAVRFVALSAEAAALTDDLLLRRIESGTGPGTVAQLGKDWAGNINGVKTYSMCGRVKRLEDGRARFRGTLVEVRPTVDEDGQLVTLGMHLARYTNADDGACVVWRADTTRTCADGRTVVVRGDPGSDPRIVALVTPTVSTLGEFERECEKPLDGSALWYPLQEEK